MKYVMFKQTIRSVVRRFPVIFPDEISHDILAAAVTTIPSVSDAIPISAGEINLDTLSTYGESTTLGLKPSVLDSAIIAQYDYFRGIL